MNRFPNPEPVQFFPRTELTLTGMQADPDITASQIHQLKAANEAAMATQGDEGVIGVLIREPENPYDPNAVQVHVPGIGKVGWVPAKTGDSARISAQLDAGYQVHCAVYARIDPDHPDNPGVTAVLWRTQ